MNHTHRAEDHPTRISATPTALHTASVDVAQTTKKKPPPQAAIALFSEGAPELSMKRAIESDTTLAVDACNSKLIRQKNHGVRQARVPASGFHRMLGTGR